MPPRSPVKTFKNVLLGILALTTVGGAVLSWRQYRELVELRATALTLNEREEWEKQVAELRNHNRELEEQLAVLAGERSAAADGITATTSEPDPAPERPRGEFRPRGDRGAAMREIMARPEVQALLASNQKAALDTRYGALFRTLNLTPDQAEKLKTLLADRQNAPQDVFAAAREQGLNPRTDRDAMRKLVEDAQATVNASIKSLLGDAGYEQLTRFEQTMPQRALVNTLQQQLTYSDSPLSSYQAEQLVNILATNNPPAGGGQVGRGPGGMFSGGNPGRTGTRISNEVVQQASAVLSTSQLNALQALQKQQQNARQLEQMIREARRAAAAKAEPKR